MEHIYFAIWSPLSVLVISYCR